jgi:aspartyl-tRNA(Asn)/glutamyl-tRNA(Gln) amidotransferase subunit A
MSLDPTWVSAERMGQAFATRRLSPVDVIGALLERIRALDPKLHAFVEVYAEDARLAAEAAERAIRAGHAVGPLHGVPIALKDLIEIEGKVVTGGAMIWRTRLAARTATLVRRLLAQGMIIIGKTHTVEFAFGGWGTNEHMGTPWNPWDASMARTPGGSSSGSGVAVAAGLVPWAIGTDTGGSVRLPASFCGITGLKTTIGRISTYAIQPLTPTLDTPGPLARSVEDAALLYGAIQGSDPLDHRTLRQPPGGLTNLKRGIRGMRLAALPKGEREGIAPGVLAAYDQSVEVLGRLGAEIVTVDLPMAFADMMALTGRIMSAEAYALYADQVEDERLPLDRDVRPRILAGRDVSSRAYLDALRQREALKERFAEATADVDALLTPTTTTTAVPLTSVDQSRSPAHFTRLANLLDLCALAIPNGISDALPASLQIIGRGYDEETVLRIGWAYQSVTDWHERHPELGGTTQSA